MSVESRDSVSLKPAELDELGQFVAGVGLPVDDQALDHHVEQFPLVAICSEDGDLHGFRNAGDTPFVYLSVTSPPVNFREAYAKDWRRPA